MFAKLKKHTAYYLSLLAMSGIGLYLISLNSFDSELRMVLVIMIAFFYILWGLLHHHVHHDLTAKVMIEYVLIGALGISIVFFLLE